MKITKRTENENQRLPVTQNDPVRSLRSIHDAMDRLFSDRLFSPLGRFGLDLPDGMGDFTPAVDISETETEVKVRAEVPGIKPDDIDIEVTEDTLSLSGKAERSLEENQENYYRMERTAGQFSREFTLPSKIDTDSVDAQAKDGIVTITLAKLPSDQKRKVEVKT